MPDKKDQVVTTPTTTENPEVANTNLDLNKGIEQQQDHWAEQPNTMLPISHNFPGLTTPQAPKEDNSASLTKLAGQINSDNSQHLEDNSFINRATLPKDVDKYDKYYPGLDNEELAANKQTGWQKAEYAVGRTVGTFGKTLLQGITAPVVGVASLFSSDPNTGFIQNDYNRWLESWDEYENKHMPLYSTKAEQNASFLGQLKYGNSYVHLLEFLGVGAGLAVTGMATGAAGEFLGGAAVSRSLGAGYMNAIGKISEIAPEISALENAPVITNELVSNINKIATSSIAKGEKLDKMLASIKEISDKYLTKNAIWNSTKQKIYGASSLMGMNAGMAAKATTEFEQNLIQKYTDKNDFTPDDEEKKKIHETANKVGEWTFGVGTIMSTLSLHGMFKGILAKGGGEEVIMNEIEALSEKASLKPGELGVTEYAKKGLPFEGASKLSKVGNFGYKTYKLGSKIFDPWSGGTLAEFSLLGPSVENYFNKQYETGHADLIADAIGPNLAKLFTTKEGWSTFFMGMLGAAPMEVGRKFKDAKTKASNTASAIEAFNDLKNSAHNYLIDDNDAMIRDKSLQDDYIEATKNSDNLNKYNIRQDKLLNYLFPRIKYGMKSLVEKDIANYKKLASTDEGIQKLQEEGILPKDGDPKQLREDFSKHLDNMLETANNMESYYKANMTRYGNLVGKDGKRIFTDAHIQKMMYLNGKTDDATKRMKTLSSELIGDKNLQDPFLNTTVNKDDGGFTTYEPTNDIPRLLTAESRSTVVVRDGEKTYQAGEIYDQITKKISNLAIPETQKQELQAKLDDMVQLNHLRKNYLKQYNDILNRPERYNEEVIRDLINPYTEDYVGKDDVLEATRMSDEIHNTIDLPTKLGKKGIIVGEEYYAGSPITVKNQGVDEGFRKFKIIKETEDGKLLIKTENGTIIPVEKDFLSKHDVGRTRNIDKTPAAKFYDKNKRKRIIRKVDKASLDPKHIDDKKAELKAQKETHIKNLTKNHTESIAENTRKIAELEKQKAMSNSEPTMRALDIEIQALKDENTNMPGKSSAEAARISAFYDRQNKDLDELADKQSDPYKHLDIQARQAYINAKKVIDDAHAAEVKAAEDKKAQDGNVDLDFEKDKIDKKRDKAIDELKDKFRTHYNKKLAEINKGQEEMGTLEYSPSNGKLQFVDGNGKESDVKPEDFKDNIRKADGTDWDGEDKFFFENAGKLATEQAQMEYLVDQAENNEKALVASDKRNYNDPKADVYEELPNENDGKEIQNKANTSIQKVITVIGKLFDTKGAKKPINVAARASVPLDIDWIINHPPKDEDPAKFKARVEKWLLRRNNWAERFNTFTGKILDPKRTDFWKNSDLKDENGNYQQPTTIFVHPGNQKELGLDGLITDKDIADAKSTPIYMVMVHTDKDGKKWTLNNEGKKLKELGTNHTENDYNDLINTVRPASLGKYQDATDADVKTYTELFKKESEEILASTGSKPIEHSITVSNGHIKTPKGTKRKTPLSKTGLVDNDKLSYPMIQIATYNGEGTTGDKITIGEKSIQVPAGVPYFVRGTSVHVMDSKKFTEKNKNHIFKCLNWLAETWLMPDVANDPNEERKGFKQTVNDYLASVVFFNHWFEQKPTEKDPKITTAKIDNDPKSLTYGFPANRYENQISIGIRKTNNKEDNLPYLMLGKSIRILFTPKALQENKQVIKDFLEKTHHVTLNKLLLKEKNSKDLQTIKYNEITDFDDKGIPMMSTWDSYTKYLTSENDANDKARHEDEVPLTMNVDQPQKGQSVMEGMYITTQKAKGESLPLSAPPKAETKEKEIPKTPASKPEPAKTSTTPVDTKSLLVTITHLKDTEGNPLTHNLNITGEPAILETNEPAYGSVMYSAKIVDGKPEVEIKSVLGGITLESINVPGEEVDPEATKDFNTRSGNMKKIITKSIQNELNKKPAEPVVTPEPVPTQQPAVSDIGRVKELEKLRDAIKAGATDEATIRKYMELFNKQATEKIGNKEIFSKDATDLLDELTSSSNTGRENRLNVIERIQKAIDKEQQPIENKSEVKPTENPVVKNEEASAVAAAMVKRQKGNRPGKTNVPDSDIIKDMVVSELRKGTPLENIAAFKEWLGRVLPGVDVKDLPDRIRNGKGGFSFGQYDPSYRTIFLGIDAVEGTGFHEAFHDVFDTFLSAKEQRTLINEFRNREGSYTNRFGETKKYSDAHTEDQIIEQIADEFREHNLTNKVYEKTPEKMTFFRRLKNFLKNFFGLDKAKSLGQVFDRINAGYYKDASSYNKKGSIKDMVFSDGSKISQQTVRDFTNGIVQHINDYLSGKEGGLSAITEGKISVKRLLDKVKEDINDILYAPDEKWSAEQLGEFSQIIHPLCDVIDNEGDPYYEINEKKWNELVEKKFIDRLQSLGLKMVKSDADIVDNHDSDSESGNSSTPEDHTEEVTKDTNKQLWGADAVKINAKDTAPKEIQFVFNTLAEMLTEGPNAVPKYNKDLEDPTPKTNSLLFNKIVEDNSLFYKTMYNLSFSATIDEMDVKFKEAARQNPNLVAPYKFFFGTETKNRTPAQWKLLVRFFKTFSKYNPENVMQRTTEDGKTYRISANADTIVTLMKKKWEGNFKGNSKVSVYNAETKSYHINPNFKFTKTKDTTSRFAFLKEIGFTGINESQFRAYVEANPGSKLEQRLSEAIDKIHSGVIEFQKKGSPVLGGTKELFGTGSKITDLAKIASEMSLDKASSQSTRLDGEYVQANLNQNTYARTIGAIRNSKNITDFLNSGAKLIKDVFTKNSLLVGENVRKGETDSQFFNKDGTPKDVTMIVDNGFVDDNGNRILLTDMTGVQRVVYSLNGLLRGRKDNVGTGIFQFFAPADQTTDFGIEMPHYISIGTFKSTDTKQGKVAKFNSIMKGYLEDEINLIKDSAERIKTEELAKEVNGSPRANQLRYFKDILAFEKGDKVNLVQIITDYANGVGEYANLSFDDFYKANIKINDVNTPMHLLINAKIREHMDKEVIAFKDYLLAEGAISNKDINGIPYLTFEGLSTDFLDKDDYNYPKRKVEGEEDQHIFSEGEIKRILEFAMMNYKIHNIELSKVFYRDPAHYKDFLKRSKMYNSGTELNFHSEEYNQHFTNEKNTVSVGKGENKKEVRLKPTDPGYRKATHNFKGTTVNWGEKANKNDAKRGIKPGNVVSRAWDFIKKYVPNSSDEYEKTNEIDAQSYKSLDARREFEEKAGTWTDAHEELYQYKKALTRLNRQERLEAGEKGLKEKLFNDPKRTNYYDSDTHKLGELSAHGKELKALDEEIVKNPPVGKKYHGLFNVTKYLGAGFTDNENGVSNPNGLKTSTLPLVHGDMMQGSALEELDMWMEKHGLDYVGPPSQDKFGRLEKIYDLYDVDSSYETMGKFNLNKLTPEEVNETSYYHPFENFNKIVETATRHEEGTVGTQLRTQASVDMMNSGLPRDFYTHDGDASYADQKAKWDAMKPAEKKAASELYKLHSEMNDTLKGMIKQAKPQVYGQLGIGEGKDGKLKLKNPKKLLDYLKDMTNTYNIPANLRDALKITTNSEGEQVIRLDQLPNRQSLEYIVNSAIEKYVVRPKMNGGPKIMVSGAMWEKNGRSGAYFDKKDNKWITVDSKEAFDAAKNAGEKIILTSNELNFYTEKDGKIKGMEIKVNNHFKAKMLEWAEKNGKNIISDEELLKYLDSEEGEKMLTGIGFRIPSQGLNSFDVFRIKGFTDDSLGDVVVVPSEITTKTGADFDVDKLNTYIKNFYLDEKGLPKLVEFYDKVTESTLEKIWEQKKQLDGEELTDPLENTLGEITTYGDVNEASKEAKDELMSLNRFIKDNMNKSAYEVNNKEAIHNHYFDTIADIVLHKSNMERLLTPNSTNILEEVDEEMSKVEKTDLQGRNKDDINYSNYLNMLWVNKKRQEMLEAKNATSISANGVTSHAMMQNFPYYLNPEVDIKLPHDKITVDHNGERKEATSLSGIMNKGGQYISEVLSQIVNTTVDAVNNPILMRLLPSIDAFSPALFLLRTGVEPKFVFFFLKQPIIKRYIDEVNRNSQRPENERMRSKKLLDMVMNHHDFKGGDPISVEKFEFSNDNKTGLKDMLGAWAEKPEKMTEEGKTNQNKGFSETNRAMQRAVLTEYLKYKDLANQLFEQQQGSYYGNMKKATNNRIWLKKNTFNKAAENQNFFGLHSNMKEDDSWHGTMKATVDELSNGLNSVLFRTTSDFANQQISSAMNYVSNLFIKGGAEEKSNLLNKVKSNFLNFLVHNFSTDKNGKKLNEDISRLVLGDHSMANRLQEIQTAMGQIEETDPNADILGNSAIKKLVAVISNPKNPKLLNIDVKLDGVNAKEDFTSSLEELKEHPGLPLKNEKGEVIKHIDLKEFYEDFVKLGIIQSGTAPGRTSWNEFTPEADYEAYTSQSLDALDEEHSAIAVYDKLKIFWRTNSGDDRIVPAWFRNTGSIGKQRKILKDGSYSVTLPAKNKEGILNSYSPVVKYKRPIFITVTEDGEQVTRPATKAELAEMRNKSDFKENLYETEGYQQVMGPTGEPVIITDTKGDKPVECYLYKPINLWGDGRNLTEHYTDSRPSVLDKNLKVNEMEDADYLSHWEQNDPQEIKTTEPSVDEKDPDNDLRAMQDSEEERVLREEQANNQEPDFEKMAYENEQKYIGEDGDTRDPSDLYSYEDEQANKERNSNPPVEKKSTKAQKSTELLKGLDGEDVHGLLGDLSQKASQALDEGNEALSKQYNNLYQQFKEFTEVSNLNKLRGFDFKGKTQKEYAKWVVDQFKEKLASEEKPKRGRPKKSVDPNSVSNTDSKKSKPPKC